MKENNLSFKDDKNEIKENHQDKEKIRDSKDVCLGYFFLIFGYFFLLL